MLGNIMPMANATSNHAVLSVVVAVKQPKSEKLALCLSSFAALGNAASIEVIIVTSGEKIHLDPEATKRLKRIFVLPEESNGVYAAYNTGCLNATSKYIIFFGFDDIALPGMDELINSVKNADDSILMYAAPCVMEGRGIHAPSRGKLSLILRNWCHQGIIYRRDYLVSNPFNLRYRIRADHHTNIRIVSMRGRRYRIVSEPVAYFSYGGLSSIDTDIEFQSDLPKFAAQTFGVHAYLLVRLKHFLDCFRRGR